MMTRRRFIKGSLAAGGLAATNPSLAATRQSGVVETNHGKVRGFVSNGVNVFKGLRYGATTAGGNRFLPPREAVSWQGIHDATKYGESAPQSRFGFEGSEDCLFLNVWTPSINDNKKRPVLVWLHGGGFRSGSGSAPMYDGVNICNKEDVVIITINHRLNMFGATHLPDIVGSQFVESGCVGMLDIVAALRWINVNISRFGGDPGRVLIFGESGGGRKVSTLLAMPVAKGLFHRAVIQSGAILRVTTPDDGTRQSELLLKELGIRRKDARKLLSMPADQLLKAHLASNKHYKPTIPVVGMTDNTPVINPLSLPDHPFDPAASSFSEDVPVIVGYNKTEETFFYRIGSLLYPQAPDRKMDFDLTHAQLLARMNKRLGVDSKSLIEAYRKDYPDASPWDLQMLISTDHPRGAYPKELATRRAELGKASTYVYRFDWTLNDEVKSPHALEIPFVFNNTRSSDWTKDHPGKPHDLSNRMSASWAAFARTGNPGTDDLPDWPAYEKSSRSMMIFDNPSRVDKNPHPRSRIAMEGVLGFS